MMATLAASTRLIWPAPIPIDCRSLVRTIAFDFTCAQRIHANSSPARCSVAGWRSVTTFQVSRLPIRSTLCASTPPAALRNSPSFDGGFMISSRRFFFFARIVIAWLLNDGATITSRKSPSTARAHSSSNSSFTPMMPPNAETGSASIAERSASPMLDPRAAPHGLVCLITAADGFGIALARRIAASRSSRLLYESSFP